MSKILSSSFVIMLLAFPANADLLTEADSLEVISKGTVISSFVGEGSSARGNKQAIYVVYDGMLFF